MTATNQLEFKGALDEHFVIELLVELKYKKLDGALRLNNGAQKCVVYFSGGDVVYAVSNLRKFRLYEILLTQQLITKQQLSKIDSFTNDGHLAKKLVADDLVRKEVLDSACAYQITAIIQEALSWESGGFDFSPTSRIKLELSVEVDLRKPLSDALAALSLPKKALRISDPKEMFRVHEGVDPMLGTSDPEVAFLLSRLGSDAMSADVLATMTGQTRSDLLPKLYDLWIHGLIIRTSWNSLISKEDAEKLGATRYELKTAALSFEKEREKKRKEEEEKAKKAKLEAEKIARSQGDIPLAEYLELIESAGTHYEMFGVSPDAKPSAIKRAYLNFAKKFHPDRFQREVEAETLEKIQSAFTELAQAYETLKDNESREVYDYKLKKAIEELRLNEKSANLGINKEDFDARSKEKMATDNFRSGYDYLLEDNINKALIHLARAVHVDDKIAKYRAYYGQALSFDPETFKKAQNELQAAVSIEPENPTYRMMLAQLLIDIGHAVRAKGELKRILKQQPNHADAQRLLDSLRDK